MEYLEYQFKIDPQSPLVNDVLASELGNLGFESFKDGEGLFLAYIANDNLDRTAIEQSIPKQLYGSALTFTIQMIPDQNWNEAWEKNYFKPIVIGNRCVIHSSFHLDVPVAEFDIVIDPKMAFGTGHHETTSLMLSELLDLDLKGKCFLDMGCGTAVLAILAALKGAQGVCGIDIDEWAVNNAKENIQLNGTPDIEILTGDADLLKSKSTFDFIFANINRNILLHDMAAYVTCMHAGSILFMSGFYESDLPVIREKAESLGLKYHHHQSKNNWVAVQFER